MVNQYVLVAEQEEQTLKGQKNSVNPRGHAYNIPGSSDQLRNLHRQQFVRKMGFLLWKWMLAKNA